MNYWTQGSNNIYVAAHRGWKAKYPENTLEAFKAALTLDVDQLETDVRVTKDGELVLIHDATVERTTNGSGAVCELTLSQLKALNAGDGAKVPTLIEFMELVKDHPTITLDIELKEYPTEGREALAYSVCDRVLKIIDDYGFTDRCVINTWSGKLHEYIHGTYGTKYRQHMYYPQRHLEQHTGPCTKNHIFTATALVCLEFLKVKFLFTTPENFKQKQAFAFGQEHMPKMKKRLLLR